MKYLIQTISILHLLQIFNASLEAAKKGSSKKYHATLKAQGRRSFVDYLLRPTILDRFSYETNLYNAISILINRITWIETKEGYKYWEAIHRHICDFEFIIISDRIAKHCDYAYTLK